MHPLFMVAVPLVLIVLGMILNSTGLHFDQPPSSQEQDPVKRLTAEKEAYRQFFDRQRTRAIARQKHVGQYGWLLLFVTIGAFSWFYVDTIRSAALSNRVASMQTLSVQESKDTVLSLTLRDGSNVKYLIKATAAEKTDAPDNNATPKETVSSWEVEQISTAMSVGNVSLPLGIALKIAN